MTLIAIAACASVSAAPAGARTTASGGPEAGITVDAGSPRVAHVTASKLTTASPKLQIDVVSGSGGAPLKSVLVKLPRGLSYSSTPTTLAGGIRAADGARLTPELEHGKLLLTLRRPARTLMVTIAAGAVTESKQLRGAAGRVSTRGGTLALRFGFTIVDATGRRAGSALTLNVT